MAKKNNMSLLSSMTLLRMLSAGILIWAVLNYPFGGWWMIAAISVYFAILRFWPKAWLVMLPAALPILDLAPLTGRFYFDEMDCLLIATLVFARWRAPIPGKSSHRLPPMALLLFELFALSTIAAVLIGAYPFPAPDLNSFSDYYSPYNGVRLGKGLLWALLLIPFIKRELDINAAAVHRLLTLGMTIGVLLAGLVIVWERSAFTGLFDFNSGYRVVGSFSGMHTGGAFIEGYLATVLPFVVWWINIAKHWLGRLFGIGVFALGYYSLMVTYARGGYIALALSMTIFAFTFLLLKKKSFKLPQAVVALLLLVIAIGISAPIISGVTMQSRFLTTDRDSQTRVAHWTDAISMMNDSVATHLFGMGMGRYPATYFWGSTEGVIPSTFGLAKEGDNTHLVLRGGDALYFEQIINVRTETEYWLRFSARASEDDAVLNLPVCEKWMLYSAKCIWLTAPIDSPNGKWRDFSLKFNTNGFRRAPWHAGRTVKFSFANLAPATLIDIDGVSIVGSDGIDLVRNGTFDKGMDHWFFTNDNHLPWHIENMWVQLYFEQGAFGLTLFVFLLAVALNSLVKRNRETDLPTPALIAAMIGFLTVGMINSLFDYPRMALLFYLIVLWAMLESRIASSNVSRGLIEKYKTS